MTSPRTRRSGRVHRRWLPALAWVPLLFAAWVLFLGEFAVNEWVAGAAAALVATLAARLVMSRGLLRSTFRVRWLSDLARALREVPVDFVVVTRALAVAMREGRREIGSFNARPFDAGGRTPRGTSWRALAAFAASWSPNAYVVDIDQEHDRRLVHDLVPRRASERPA